MAPPTIAGRDGAKPTPAAHAFLLTAELLENILLSLPLHDLLLAQKVCKFLKASIEGSTKVQTALFYRPSGKDLVNWKKRNPESNDHTIEDGKWCHSDSHETTPLVNPLMQRFIILDWYDVRSILHVGFVSPIFDRSEYDRSKYFEYDPEGEEGKDPDGHMGPRSTPELKALHRERASWRKMLFMQPACEKIRFQCEEKSTFFCVENSKGITLQDVFGGLREHWFVCPDDPNGRVIKRWDFEGCIYDEVDCEVENRDHCGWSLLQELKNK